MSSVRAAAIRELLSHHRVQHGRWSVEQEREIDLQSTAVVRKMEESALQMRVDPNAPDFLPGRWSFNVKY